jgi:hypothetical protein
VARLSGHGLAIDVPRHWDAHIFRRFASGPETAHAILHAGNFALPAAMSDYGDGAVQTMAGGHVLVTLVEFHPSSTGTALFAARGLPLPLRPEQANRTTLQHALGGQAGIQRFFSVRGRAWCLYVVLGSFEERERLVAAVNAVVSTVEVQAA